MLPYGTNPLHSQSLRGNPVIRGELKRPVLDPRAVDGPWAPNFAGGYTPPFFNAEEEEEDDDASGG